MIILHNKNKNLILSAFFSFAVTGCLECYKCFGDIEYCNTTSKKRQTQTCKGPQYSCMLYFDETRRLEKINENNEVNIIKTIRQGCIVENKDYCVSQMNKEPGIYFCKV